MKLGDVEILRGTANPATILDGRGAIYTWIPDDEIREFNLLYFNAGKSRGNHYHPEFTEYFIVLKGVVALFTLDPVSRETLNMICSEGTVFKSAPGVPHAIHAISDSQCMSLITKPWDECNIPVVYEELLS